MNEIYGEYQAQYESFVDTKYEYRYFVQMGSKVTMSNLDGSMILIEFEEPKKFHPIFRPVYGDE